MPIPRNFPSQGIKVNPKRHLEGLVTCNFHKVFQNWPSNAAFVTRVLLLTHQTVTLNSRWASVLDLTQNVAPLKGTSFKPCGEGWMPRSGNKPIFTCSAGPPRPPSPQRCLQKRWRGEIRDHKGRTNSPFMQRECQGIPLLGSLSHN